MSWKQRYVKNSFLAEVLFKGTIDWKLLQKKYFFPGILTIDYLFKKNI